MTSRTTTWNDEAWTDEDEAAYEDHCEALYEATRVWGNTNRDSKGRFARTMVIAKAAYERTLCYDAEGGITHSHDGCPEIRYAGATVEADTNDRGTGWLCSTCITVVVAEPNLVPMHGHETCECCGHVLHVKRFPTVEFGGEFIRDTRVCRKCRKAGGRPKSSFFAVVPEVEGWNDDDLDFPAAA